MLRRFLLGIMVLSLASLAWAGIPDPANSEVSFYDVSDVSLLNLPSGLGDRFDAARPGGVDATITITLRDAANNPVVLYSFEDLFLVFTDLFLCPGQTPYPDDGSTDENGQTFWSGSLFAGGCNVDDIFVSVGGTLLPYPINTYNFNSPDMNGDGAISGLDAVFFRAAFGTADYCADLNFDGSVTGLDAVLFRGNFGANCP